LENKRRVLNESLYVWASADRQPESLDDHLDFVQSCRQRLQTPKLWVEALFHWGNVTLQVQEVHSSDLSFEEKNLSKSPHAEMKA
jgi:hypothetical protein